MTGGGVDVVVTFMDDESRAEALRLATELRAQKRRVDVFPEASRKFDKPLKYASGRGARVMAIFGENERARGEVEHPEPADARAADRRRATRPPPFIASCCTERT